MTFYIFTLALNKFTNNDLQKITKLYIEISIIMKTFTQITTVIVKFITQMLIIINFQKIY